MKELMLFLIAVLIVGCADMPDSNIRWEKVSCNGFQGWDACMQVAKKNCANGFIIANQKEDIVTQVRKMNYSCKK